MKRKIAFSLLIFSINLNYITSESPNLTRRIAGLGAVNAEQTLKFWATIFVSCNIAKCLENKNWASVCNGAVIQPRWVLTAAHCVKKTEISDMRIGHDGYIYNELEKNEEKHYEIFQIVIQKDYYIIEEDDIALIKTKIPLNVEQKTLPLLNYYIPPNHTMATLYSMGPSDETVFNSNQLKYAAVFFYNDVCAAYLDITKFSCYRMVGDSYTLPGDSAGPIYSGQNKENGKYDEVLVAIHIQWLNTDSTTKEREFMALNIHNQYAWIQWVLQDKSLISIEGRKIDCCNDSKIFGVGYEPPNFRTTAEFETF